MDIEDRLCKIKKELGDELLIMAHYYQQDEICKYADLVGDSYQLALTASTTKSRYIVLCGVFFMAETARILARPDQRVYLPVLEAGCPLADTIQKEEFEKHYGYWHSLFADSLVPLLYVNSSSEIKSAVGRSNGAICTSANAIHISRHYLNQGKKIFFLPDKNLGMNIASALGLTPKEIMLFDPGKSTLEIDPAIKFIVWNGFCYVHTKFTLVDIEKAKIRYPYGKILVHPECPPEVVQKADFCGSTSQILAYIKKAEPGDVLFIGTEFNFVNRIAKSRSDISVFPLKRSLCMNMAKTKLQDLYKTIKNLKDLKNNNELIIDSKIQIEAKRALQNMIDLTEAK